MKIIKTGQYTIQALQVGDKGWRHIVEAGWSKYNLFRLFSVSIWDQYDTYESGKVDGVVIFNLSFAYFALEWRVVRNVNNDDR